jgi:DNA repair protein RecO (recombination protein O)
MNPLAAVLNTFNRVELVCYWRDGRTVQKLGEAVLLDPFPGIKVDLDKTMYGAFPLELAYNVTHENEPSERAYSTLVLGLEGLASWSGDIKTHAAWQVVQLLSVAGFEPTVERCVECGKPIVSPAGFAYRGGVTCAGCRADQKLSPRVYESLSELVHARHACPSVEAGGEVFRLLCGYAARQVDAEFRSLRVIHEMLGRTGLSHTIP